MYPFLCARRGCFLFAHETLDDCKRVASYASLPMLEQMLQTMPVSRGTGNTSPLSSPGPANANPPSATGFVIAKYGCTNSGDGGISGGVSPSSTVTEGGQPLGYFREYVMATRAAAPGENGSDAFRVDGEQQANSKTKGKKTGDGCNRAVSSPAKRQAGLTTSVSSASARKTQPLPPLLLPSSPGSDSFLHSGSHNDSGLLELGRKQQRLVSLHPSFRDGCRAITRVSAAMSPLSLCVGGAVSVMGSSAEFSPDFTYCHCVDGLSEEDVSSIWYTTATLAAEYVIQPGNGHRPRLLRPQSHRCSCVDGAFVLRTDDTTFTVGLVTRCSPADPHLQVVLDDYRVLLNRDLTRTLAELPIGAGLRRCQLRLWWPPRPERVVPGRAMPPVKVTLEDWRWGYAVGGAQSRKGWPVLAEATEEAAPTTVGTEGRRGPVVFKGYNDVCVYLFRPNSSRLGGVKRHGVPHQLGIRRCNAKLPPPAYMRLVRPTNLAGSGGGGGLDSYFSSGTEPLSVGEDSLFGRGGSSGGRTRTYASASASVSPYEYSLPPPPPLSPPHQETSVLMDGDCDDDGTEEEAMTMAERDSLIPDDEWEMNGIAFWSVSDGAWPRPRPHARVSRRMADCGCARVHIFFDGLWVDNVGEHLVAFEANVETDYRPFVPILSTHLAPFLVVAAEEENS